MRDLGLAVRSPIDVDGSRTSQIRLRAMGSDEERDGRPMDISNRERGCKRSIYGFDSPSSKHTISGAPRYIHVAIHRDLSRYMRYLQPGRVFGATAHTVPSSVFLPAVTTTPSSGQHAPLCPRQRFPSARKICPIC